MKIYFFVFPRKLQMSVSAYILFSNLFLAISCFAVYWGEGEEMQKKKSER